MDNRNLSETLMSLGISPNTKGFHCLRLAVTFSLRSSVPLKLSGELYPKIGKELDMTHAAVERCIRHSITAGWSHRDRRFAHDLFSFTLQSADDVPSPSLFIAVLREYYSNQSSSRSHSDSAAM